MRPPSRAKRITSRPPPSLPSSALAGSRACSRVMVAATAPRRPSLFVGRPNEIPGVSVGTRNADRANLPSIVVPAKTRASCASKPPVTKLFVPRKTQASPSRRATVARPSRSEPPPGSVSAKQPSFAPLARRAARRAAALRCQSEEWVRTRAGFAIPRCRRRRASAGQFFDHERTGHGVEPESAPRARHCHASIPDLARRSMA